MRRYLINQPDHISNIVTLIPQLQIKEWSSRGCFETELQFAIFTTDLFLYHLHNFVL